MKRIITILSTLCLGFILSAQTGVIKTRPANDPSGKILTMEETTLSRALTPANLWCSWQDDSHLLMNKHPFLDGGIHGFIMFGESFHNRSALFRLQQALHGLAPVQVGLAAAWGQTDG